MAERLFKQIPKNKLEVEGKPLIEDGRHFTIEVPGYEKPLVWTSAFYDYHRGCWWGMIDNDNVCWWPGPYWVTIAVARLAGAIPGRGALKP